MPNKTIYVKDESLWERAKAVAGADGLSAFIADAITDAIERKQSERGGFPLTTIPVVDGTVLYDLRFYGKSITSTLIGRGPDNANAVIEAFKTKGGRLVIVVREEASERAVDHRVYDRFEEFVEGDIFMQIPSEDRARFQEEIADAFEQNISIWID